MKIEKEGSRKGGIADGKEVGRGKEKERRGGIAKGKEGGERRRDEREIKRRET